MPTEVATYINQLDGSLPQGPDLVREGDDHLRLIKTTVKATFPNVAGAVTPTHVELNYLSGVTSAIQTQISAKAALAGGAYTGTHDFSGATGVVLPANTTIGTVTSAEVARLSGVTSAIQTQLDGKAAKSGATYTGTHNFTGAALTAQTVGAGDSSNTVATTAFVAAASFSTNLPGQAGNSGRFLTTDGTNASWGDPSFQGGTVPNVTTFTGATGDIGKTGVFETVEIRGASGAGMTFNRNGSYQLNLGLASDNTFKLGGGSDGANVFRITVDSFGNLVARGNVTASSDERLKTDLQPIADALGKVRAITGYTFKRTDTGERQTGLIAQEVQRVLPEAVQTGEHLSVAYGQLAGLFVQAIKELSDKVAQLEASE